MKAAAQAVGMDTVLFNTRGVPYEGKSLHLESIMFSTSVFSSMVVPTYNMVGGKQE